jgi:lysophospholipid acyltransferase (LPLAT)-like uncharacterized protein
VKVTQERIRSRGYDCWHGEVAMDGASWPRSPQITSLIPAKNASIAAMHGSASRSNVRYYST